MGPENHKLQNPVNQNIGVKFFVLFKEYPIKKYLTKIDVDDLTYMLKTSML